MDFLPNTVNKLCSWPQEISQEPKKSLNSLIVKLENEIIHLFGFRIKSLLNINLLANFYQEFLPLEIEKSFREKIFDKDYNCYLISVF